MKKNIFIAYLAVILLLMVHFLLGLDTIRHTSPTYDEPLHLAAGYSYWKTDKFYLNIYDHPPLAEMISAIPVTFMNPSLLTTHPFWQDYKQYSFANLFLYNNRVPAEKMLNSGRVMILLFSCMLGFLVFLWAKELYGAVTAILVLFFYVFSSNFLAHGTVVSTDMIFILFFFAGVYLFWHFMKTQEIKYVILCGMSTGLALCSKFSAPVIFLIYLVIYLIELRYNKKITFYSTIKFTAMFTVVLVLTMLFVYKFSYLGLYFDGMNQMFKSMDRGRSSFLAGLYSTTGWKHYFLVNFLIKTPVPFIILLLLSLVFVTKVSHSPSPHPSPARGEGITFLLIPAGVYFLIASFSKVQIGLRHILPVYPFLFIWSGNMIKYVLTTNYKVLTLNWVKYLLLFSLFGWYAVSCISTHPWHLSYFNELTGGPKQGYKYLTDSNVDWGQGLKELGLWTKKNNIDILYMCYFGVGDPHYYGIKYVPIGFIDNLVAGERSGDDIFPKNKIVFAVSATNLQATYYANKDLFSWLKKSEPVEIIADSILVYDLTGKPEGLQQLSDLLKMTGNNKQAEYLKIINK